MKSKICLTSLLPLLLAPLATASPLFTVGTVHRNAAPILSTTNSKEIPDSYLVVFKKNVSEATAATHTSWVMTLSNPGSDSRFELKKRNDLTEPIAKAYAGLRHTFNLGGKLLGYSGHFSSSDIEAIRNHPDVDFIEKDSEVHAIGDGDHDHDNPKDPDPQLERSAPWGLARISHRDGLGLSDFNKYLYSSNAGEGVDVYVIDTGTYIHHEDFENRATWGKTIPDGDLDEDGNGHGTHCSGTIAGKKYGVAKKAHVRAVKVLRSNGSGSMSDVVKGVEFATEQHLKSVEDAKHGKRPGFKGSAANMSLGGVKSRALDMAVNAAVELGLHFAVAAGNDNSDSCGYSPAGAEKAVTVGASTLLDERAYFSNYGPCNDIFAPGLNIESTWIGGKKATNVISGTSMASPHVAGLLAYLLSLQPAHDSEFSLPSITPSRLKENLISIATVDALSDVPDDTKNILAWNGGGSSDYKQIVQQGGYLVKNKKKTTTSTQNASALFPFASPFGRLGLLHPDSWSPEGSAIQSKNIQTNKPNDDQIKGLKDDLDVNPLEDLNQQVNNLIQNTETAMDKLLDALQDQMDNFFADS